MRPQALQTYALSDLTNAPKYDDIQMGRRSLELVFQKFQYDLNARIAEEEHARGDDATIPHTDVILPMSQYYCSRNSGKI